MSIISTSYYSINALTDQFHSDRTDVRYINSFISEK